MLAVKRKIDEKLIIRGQDGKIACTILVISVGHEWVRLGCDAPMEIEINREEVDREKHPGDYRKGGAT